MAFHEQVMTFLSPKTTKRDGEGFSHVERSGGIYQAEGTTCNLFYTLMNSTHIYRASVMCPALRKTFREDVDPEFARHCSKHMT